VSVWKGGVRVGRGAREASQPGPALRGGSRWKKGGSLVGWRGLEEGRGLSWVEGKGGGEAEIRPLYPFLCFRTVREERDD
jgi:hypothetical protein